jgi:hypothetical protein
MAQKALRQTEGPSPDIPTDQTRLLETLSMLLGIAITLYILATTLIVIRNCYFPIPLSDQWDEWQLFFTSKHYSSFLFSQHNEHRIVLARFFFYIDQFVFHARNTFLLVSISLIQVITGLLLLRLTLSSARFSRTSSVLLGCFVFSCLFSAQQFNNFTWGFQVQFVAVYCAAAAAVFALARAAGKHAGTWLAAACFFAVLSTYSMSNGLVIWPILLIMSFWLRLPVRYYIVLGAGMAVMSTLYLWGYHSPGHHADPVDSLTRRLPQVLTFAAVFLGSPADSPISVLLRRLGGLSDGARVTCCTVFGLAGVLASLGCLAVLWRKRQTVRPEHIALFCILMFVMATSFLVGLGRVNFPLTDALVSRYATPAMIFWTTLVSLGWCLYGPELLESRLRPRYLVYAALLLSMLAGIAAGQPQWIAYSKGYESGVGDFESVVVSGVDDAEVLHASYHTPSAIFPIAEYMKNNRLSVFTEDWTHWAGTPLTPHFAPETGKSCVGNFDSATFIPSAARPGSKVSGWAWDQKDARAPEMIILADQSGRIVGVAHNMVERDDVTATQPFPKSAKIGWRGYILPTEANPVTAYVLESDGKSLCALGSMASGYRIQQATFSDLLGPIEGAVGVEGAWMTTANAYHQDAGKPPFDGPIYGSWGGSDANTGTLHLGPFRVANQVAIAIPVVSGPNNGGLVLKVVNAKTGELIAALAPPPIRMKWWAWRVNLPTQPDLTVNIVAEDMGSAWGQWQAVGMPHFLRYNTLGPLVTVNQSAQEIPLSAVGAAVESSTAPSIEGFWTKDGYFPGVGRPPIEGSTYGSWAGSDAHTGIIRMGPFTIRGQQSIAIPMISGPSNTGMQITVADAATGEIIALLSPPPVHLKWWAWKINLPAARPEMKIVIAAEDNGSGWAQWQAVGVPHLLK